MDEVEHKHGLLEEAVPKVKRKDWVTSDEACDQVILVIMDRSFGSVGAMEVRRDKLEIDALLMHEPLQADRAFIIHNLEERADTAVTEVGVEDLIGTAKFLRAALLEGFNQDGIAVMVKEDHEVFAVAAGSHG